jgi:hypothetical protein
MKRVLFPVGVAFVILVLALGGWTVDALRLRRRRALLQPT